MLGDNIQANKLTDAYQDLDKTMAMDSDDEGDGAKTQIDLDQFKMKKQSPSLIKPKPCLKASSKKPLIIDVIDEAEDEDASVNPYGLAISPGAAAGDKIFFSQGFKSIETVKKSKQYSNDSEFFEGLSKRSMLRPLQTPKNPAQQSFDMNAFTCRNSEGKKDKDNSSPLKSEMPSGFSAYTKLQNRKDPHEEFFKLTLLAFKLNNKVSNSVLTVSSLF